MTYFDYEIRRRKSHRELNVTIGAGSLITPEPEEQSISIADLITFNGFNQASLIHDIALIEVYSCKQTRPIDSRNFELMLMF